MTYLLVLLVFLSLALSGCGSEKEESDDDSRSLTVQAGPDQTAHPGATVILSGTAGGPGGTTLTYLWQQTGGPFVALTGADSLSVTFTAPDVSIDQTFTFRLTVANDRGTSASDQTSVTVFAKTPEPEPEPTNRLPIIGLPVVEQAGDVMRTLGDPTKDLDLFEIDYASDDYVCTHTDPDAQGFTYFNVYERDTYDPPDGVFVIGGTVSTSPPGIIAFEISCDYQTVTPVAPGTTTVTITLTNASGATTTTSFQVTIQDLNRAILNAFGRTCTNEADEAALYAALPRVWDGTAFPVDVSSAFENAVEIMDEVEAVALSIHRALGYWILTPGEIITWSRGRNKFGTSRSATRPTRFPAAYRTTSFAWSPRAASTSAAASSTTSKTIFSSTAASPGSANAWSSSPRTWERSASAAPADRAGRHPNMRRRTSSGTFSDSATPVNPVCL